MQKVPGVKAGQGSSVRVFWRKSRLLKGSMMSSKVQWRFNKMFNHISIRKHIKGYPHTNTTWYCLFTRIFHMQSLRGPVGVQDIRRLVSFDSAIPLSKTYQTFTPFSGKHEEANESTDPSPTRSWSRIQTLHQNLPMCIHDPCASMITVCFKKISALPR